jgi:uncharacterized membrane protein
MEIIANIVGIIGVLMLLFAYFYVQLGKIQALGLSFPVLNLIGSLFILFSLFYEWNLPAVLIEAAWSIISLFGIWRWYKQKLN